MHWPKPLTRDGYDTRKHRRKQRLCWPPRFIFCKRLLHVNGFARTSKAPFNVGRHACKARTPTNIDGPPSARPPPHRLHDVRGPRHLSEAAGQRTIWGAAYFSKRNRKYCVNHFGQNRKEIDAPLGRESILATPSEWRPTPGLAPTLGMHRETQMARARCARTGACSASTILASGV